MVATDLDGVATDLEGLATDLEGVATDLGGVAACVLSVPSAAAASAASKYTRD